MEWYYVWWPWLTSKYVARVCQHHFTFITNRPGLGVIQGHRYRHGSIRHLWLPINVYCMPMDRSADPLYAHVSIRHLWTPVNVYCMPIAGHFTEEPKMTGSFPLMAKLTVVNTSLQATVFNFFILSENSSIVHFMCVFSGGRVCTVSRQPSNSLDKQTVQKNCIKNAHQKVLQSPVHTSSNTIREFWHAFYILPRASWCIATSRGSKLQSNVGFDFRSRRGCITTLRDYIAVHVRIHVPVSLSSIIWY